MHASVKQYTQTFPCGQAPADGKLTILDRKRKFFYRDAQERGIPSWGDPRSSSWKIW